MTPVSPYKDVDFKRITLGNKRAIKSVSKKDKWGFKEGDLVESSLVKKYALTEFGYMPDGEIYTVEVERNGKPVTLSITNSVKETKIQNYLFRMKTRTAEQDRTYKVWMKM
jgi:hypothetical protein